jgi:hypothetical protein
MRCSALGVALRLQTTPPAGRGAELWTFCLDHMSVLDTPDDFKLCDQVWCALSGDTVDVGACDELERVVRLVWDSSGLIGNGGFHRFFEGDFPGDPGFVYTLGAYKRIRAEAACEALQAAFGQFPGGVLPADIHERLRIFESVPEQTRAEIEGRYYDADKETEHCLARFIREHRGGFEQRLEARGAEP